MRGNWSRALACSLSAMFLIGCDARSDRTAVPTEPLARESEWFANAAVEADPAARAYLLQVEVRRNAARDAIAEVLRDAEVNGNFWFGARELGGQRDRAEVCRGIAALLGKHLPQIDLAYGRVRSESARATSVSATLIAVGCERAQQPASIFGLGSNVATAFVATSAPLMRDEWDDYVADSLRPTIQDEMDAYAAIAPGKHLPFTAGMTALEAGVFDG